MFEQGKPASSLTVLTVALATTKDNGWGHENWSSCGMQPAPPAGQDVGLTSQAVLVPYPPVTDSRYSELSRLSVTSHL